MTNAQIGSQWQDAISGYAEPAPITAPVLHLPQDVLAALRHEDADPTNWQTVDPDQFRGWSDATSDEGGLT